MLEIERKILIKDFEKIDITNWKEELLAIAQKNLNLTQKEILDEYSYYQENERKQIEKIEEKNKKINEIIKKFIIKYPKEEVTLFRNLVDEFENVYPLDMPVIFEEYINKFEELKYDDILGMYYYYEFLDIKTACKSYKIKNNAINFSVVKILQELINQAVDNEVNPVSRNKISKLFQLLFDPEKILVDINSKDLEHYLIYKDIKNMDNMIKKSLNYLRCFGIAYFKKTGKNTEYYIDLSDWFKDGKYFIANKELLKKLVPLLVEYIKSSEKSDIYSFFEKIDSVLEYVLQPFENHNETFELEKYFLDNITNEVSTRLMDDSNTKNNLTLIMGDVEISTKIITITPIKILFSEDKKYLEYSDENDNVYKVPLSEVVRVQIYDDNIINNIKGEITQDFSCVNAYITDKNNKGIDCYYLCNPKYLEAFKDKVPLKEKLEKIILELPLTALEFFKIKPLENMKIYATADEIIEFENIIDTEEFKAIIPGDFKVRDSYFYVIANDTINNATAIILDTLSDIRIVAPKNLHSKIISIFNRYSNNSKI